MQDTGTGTPSALTFSLPRILLHLEGFAVLVLVIVLYRQFAETGWWFFGILLLSPDLAALGYLVNTQVGAIGYNAAHNYVLPIFVGLVALAMGWGIAFAYSLVWAAHIGMDRTVGYGLKYPESFKETHLKRV